MPISQFGKTAAKQETFEVQGRQTGSVNEYYVANALDGIGLEYDFQQALRGGYRAGGFVVDFIVYTPFPVPLEVYGDYWHMGSLSSGDRYRLDVIESIYRRKVEIIWGRESDTQEKAEDSVRRLFEGVS